ncbi:hypothetical protein QWZ13_04925 [Reinekea marina]|uniref:hypothetical protein n=1 Tax=Reinekea marina TaxID=1310421 RepID=UPI0025B31C8C|nr:hypothetical protein [Reinekea marina]MDN3648250.1 hypothetical protein [Reinekea marina]
MSSLCYEHTYLNLELMVSFGGGFRWSGHLRHGCRSLAVLDARTATRGSGTRRQSGNSHCFRLRASSCGFD